MPSPVGEGKTVSAIGLAMGLAAGAGPAVEHEAFARGGEGALELAEATEAAAARRADFRPLYRREDGARVKIERLATQLYGAAQVGFSAQAGADLERFKAGGDRRRGARTETSLGPGAARPWTLAS